MHRHGYVGLVGRFLDGDGDFLVFGAGGNAQGGSRFAAGRLEGLRGGGRAVAVRCAVIGIIERRATGQREHMPRPQPRRRREDIMPIIPWLSRHLKRAGPQGDRTVNNG